jgi:hypothetical protein
LGAAGAVQLAHRASVAGPVAFSSKILLRGIGMHDIRRDRPGLIAPIGRYALPLLVALLCVDAIFLVLHFVNAISIEVNHRPLSLEHDRGYAEWFQYFKFFALVSLMVAIAYEQRLWQFIPWAMVFAYFLVDDCWQIRERVGDRLATEWALAPQWGLRPLDQGDMLVTIAVASLFLPLMVWAYWTGHSRYRTVFRQLVALVMGLAFFGLFVDMVHVAVDLGSKIRFGLGVVEELGEMVMTSLLVAYVFAVRQSSSPSRRGLIRRLRAEAPSRERDAVRNW